MKNKMNVNLWMSRIGLGLIACYCFLASLLCANFAQIHLTLSFLPFPIFISEMVMFVCFILLGWVCRKERVFPSQTMFFLIIYFGWVGGKALINYFYDGPLTLRNAMLFYYPIFTVFTYCFYQKAKIPRYLMVVFAFLAAGILFFKIMAVYYWWTYVLLFVIVFWKTRIVSLRWIAWVFLAGIFLLGSEYLYKGPRAHFVSVFCSAFFLAFYFGILLIKRNKFFYVSILVVGFVMFICGFFLFSNRNAVSSVISLKGIILSYQEKDKMYRDNEKYYVPQSLSIQLYHPKKFEPFVTFLSSPEVLPTSIDRSLTVKPTSLESVPVVVQASTSSTLQDPSQKAPSLMEQMGVISKNLLRSRIRGDRTLELDENNIVFRLFVWRDMARELIKEKAWWGFSFGKPQRSRSLEVLHWAEGEWARDGWITPHNSFLHIIYRAGILGVCLIGVLFFLIGRLVRDFLMMSSVEGGLLVGSMIYWLMLSNFFLILELPYNAIVFWTLFGLAWAYHDQLKEKFIKQEG